MSVVVGDRWPDGPTNGTVIAPRSLLWQLLFWQSLHWQSLHRQHA